MDKLDELQTKLEDYLKELKKAKPTLEDKIKAKKEQYKNIDTPMADPMKVNTNIAIRDLKDDNDKIKKDEEKIDPKDIASLELPKKCTSCGKGTPKLKAVNNVGKWWDCADCRTTGVIVHPKAEKLFKEEYNPEKPNLASPEHPKGLEGKRKPVTHDECGRPFAKDEDDLSEPDDATKNFLDHFEPATKHPKEVTAGMPKSNVKGQKITPTGFKLKAVKKSLIKFDKNGQWTLDGDKK
jgi:hypothetical protein